MNFKDLHQVVEISAILHRQFQKSPEMKKSLISEIFEIFQPLFQLVEDG